MHRISQLLMAAGLIVGGAVAAAMVAHVGFPSASWLMNVALAKLALVGAGGLIGGGAVVGRIARRREQRQLEAPAAGRDSPTAERSPTPAADSRSHPRS